MSLIKLMSNDTSCNGNSIKWNSIMVKNIQINNYKIAPIISIQIPLFINKILSHMQFVKIKIKIIEQPRELIIEKTGFKQKNKIK